jgi:alginate O-acetyltransferase complex protein AlgI
VIFNTLEYYLFFLFPAAALFRIAHPDWRPWVCVFFGSVFFIYFSLTAVGGLLGAFCLLIFYWESLLSRLYFRNSIWCLVGIAVAVGILVLFKYWNFLTGLVFRGTNLWQWHGAFLPLGISFFTFEFIHYAVDRYKGTAPRGRLRDYLAFILFFQTMVAGPIKRYQDFLPTLLNPSMDTAGNWNMGITRILVGLVKKFAVADVMTAFTSHLNTADISNAQRWVLPIWLFAYGIKIYFDFSAYSDIAIGSSRLLGLRVKENFDWPYFRTDIAAFWRHWHMSLYQWLVDYVFIPLGGSRVTVPLVYRNVLLTMLLSGIWHGAGLNFVVWGLWHGIMLCIHRLWIAWRGSHIRVPTWPGRIASWALTFVSVNLGWAFFAMDLPTAMFFLRRMFLG